MQRLLTDNELRLLSAGLTALRGKIARDATGSLVAGYDHAVQALLAPVNALDNLTALLARDDLNFQVNISGTDRDAARIVSELSGSARDEDHPHDPPIAKRRRVPQVGPRKPFVPDLASDYPPTTVRLRVEASHA